LAQGLIRSADWDREPAVAEVWSTWLVVAVVVHAVRYTLHATAVGSRSGE
jgi:hypothetical protein